MDPHITLAHLQEYIRAKDHQPHLKNTYLMKLMEEVGELSKAMRAQEYKQEKRTFNETGEIKGTIDEELYDILYYTMALANLYDIDMEDTARRKEKVNDKKYGRTSTF